MHSLRAGTMRVRRLHQGTHWTEAKWMTHSDITSFAYSERNVCSSNEPLCNLNSLATKPERADCVIVYSHCKKANRVNSNTFWVYKNEYFILRTKLESWFNWDNILSLFSNISNTRGFIGISKHRKEIWKYDAQRSIFWRNSRRLDSRWNTVLSVWYILSIETKTKK